MFQIRYAICFAVVGLAVLLSGCNPNPKSGAPSLRGEYDMNAVCDTFPELRIKKVTVTDDKTIFNLVFKSSKTTRVRTGAPGQQVAFYIADPNSREEYKLLNVEGIALEPVWTPVQIGDSVAFKLTFERIPDSLTSFHLIEGKTPSLSEDGIPTRSWTFMNVKLK